MKNILLKWILLNGLIILYIMHRIQINDKHSEQQITNELTILFASDNSIRDVNEIGYIPQNESQFHYQRVVAEDELRLDYMR